ncbi:MAG: hypothetical protein IKJ33_03150 [Clostridia bacterium]|nr:hypothetical protein [Clostridia bacterium]
MKKFTKFFKFLTFSLIVLCSFLYFSNTQTNQSSNFSYAAEQVTSNNSAKNKLDSNTQKLYSFLAEQVNAVANGTQEDTTFIVSKDTLVSWGVKLNWTASEIGQSTITSQEAFNLFEAQFNVSKVLTALLHDFPYEMYWFDKTVGISKGASTSYTDTYVDIEAFKLKFDVCEEFQPADYDEKNPSIDISKTTAPKQALANAKQIVNDYSSLNDHQKLNAYKNKICELVSYNDSAVENPTPYGNPWQPIYVFDEDPTTNVVCEGYAKAFQLLCNLSSFKSSYVKCYTVSGNMIGGTGAGAHMWNVVTMDDQQSYLVDVTNCDNGTVGYPEDLFLTGTDSGSINTGYSFDLSPAITFTYNTTTLDFWGSNAESALNLNTRNYEANYPTIIVTSGTLVYNKTSISAGLSGTENVNIVFTFESTDWVDSEYDWTFDWFEDNNNHIGSKLSNAPVNANFYWLKITATNKTDNSIKYVHSERIEIKPKEIFVDSVVGQNKTYDGTQIVSITESTLKDVLDGDEVSINHSTLIAKIKNANVGEYELVDLSEISLIGEDANNYFISPVTNIPSNKILVTTAKPTFSETFDKITEKGKKISQLNITITAKGVLDEAIEGTYIWTDAEGNEIDPATTEIIEGATYYYTFTPSDSNYEKTIVEVTLWEDQPDTFKDLFKKDNRSVLIGICGLIVVIFVIIGVIIKVSVNQGKKQF